MLFADGKLHLTSGALTIFFYQMLAKCRLLLCRVVEKSPSNVKKMESEIGKSKKVHPLKRFEAIEIIELEQKMSEQTKEWIDAEDR